MVANFSNFILIEAFRIEVPAITNKQLFLKVSTISIKIVHQLTSSSKFNESEEKP